MCKNVYFVCLDKNSIFVYFRHTIFLHLFLCRELFFLCAKDYCSSRISSVFNTQNCTCKKDNF